MRSMLFSQTSKVDGMGCQTLSSKALLCTVVPGTYFRFILCYNTTRYDGRIYSLLFATIN